MLGSSSSEARRAPTGASGAAATLVAAACGRSRGASILLALACVYMTFVACRAPADGSGAAAAVGARRRAAAAGATAAGATALSGAGGAGGGAGGGDCAPVAAWVTAAAALSSAPGLPPPLVSPPHSSASSSHVSSLAGGPLWYGPSPFRHNELTRPLEGPAVGAVYVTFRRPKSFLNSMAAFRAAYPDGDMLLFCDVGCHNYSHAARYFGARYFGEPRVLSTKALGSIYVRKPEALNHVRTYREAVNLMRSPFWMHLEDDVYVMRRVGSGFGHDINGWALDKRVRGIAESFIRARVGQHIAVAKGNPAPGELVLGGFGGCVYGTDFWRRTLNDPGLERFVEDVRSERASSRVRANERVRSARVRSERVRKRPFFRARQLRECAAMPRGRNSPLTLSPCCAAPRPTLSAPPHCAAPPPTRAVL